MIFARQDCRIIAANEPDPDEIRLVRLNVID